MPSTRRQKAKARKSREMDMLSDFENLDVMLGNENGNPIERELAEAIDQSSAHGDADTNMYRESGYRDYSHENDMLRQNEVRQSFETFSNEFNLRLSPEMDSMMSMMHNQINRAITTAINERVIPEIQNIASSMSSAGHRNTEASLSPNSQENRESASGPKMKFARKDSRSVGDLRDTTGHDSHYIPRLSEKLVPFFQLLKKNEKVLVTPEIIEQFNEINRDLDRCSQLALRQPLPNRQLVLMTDASFTAAGYAILTEDDPNQKFTSVKKSYAPIAYGSKTFIPSQLKMSIYAKEFLAIYFAFKEFGHIFWGTPKPVIILTDNKSVTRFFQTKIISPPLWNACDFVIQFNFTIAHIPGKNNTAADYLSRMEMDPTEKLVLKIRADVETQPIEVNVQSAGVSEEEQVFSTEEDNETEGQTWERKRQSKEGLKVTETVIQIDAISENVVDEITNFTQKLRRTNQILLEQSKDPILLQLKAKIQNEEYSEEILQQDIRYRHYLNNLDRIFLKEEIVTRKYYDETGQIKYHQILLPKHLLKELLQAIHGTAHRHPGISKMLQEIRLKYYYPSIAKHVKKWVEGCETCARDKRFPNNTITPELLNLPEWDLGPEDAMQIDLLPNLPTSGGFQTVMTAIDVFFKIPVRLPAK